MSIIEILVIIGVIICLAGWTYKIIFNIRINKRINKRIKELNHNMSFYHDKCPHCKFLSDTFCIKSKRGKHFRTNREYWLMTEVFVYLHGSDECNYERIKKKVKNYATKT